MKTKLILLGIAFLSTAPAFAGNFDTLEKVIRSKGTLSRNEYRSRVGAEIVRAVKTTDRQMHERFIDLTTDVPRYRDISSHAQFSGARGKALDEMTAVITELRKILRPVLKNGGATSEQIKLEIDRLKQMGAVSRAYDSEVPEYKGPGFNPALERALDGLAYLHVVLPCKLPLEE